MSDRKCPICNQQVNESGRCTNTECSAYSHKVLEELPKEVICEDCDGEGKTMRMVCYGGPPLETYDECETCYGEGVIEIDD